MKDVFKNEMLEEDGDLFCFNYQLPRLQMDLYR